MASSCLINGNKFSTISVTKADNLISSIRFSAPNSESRFCSRLRLPYIRSKDLLIEYVKLGQDLE